MKKKNLLKIILIWLPVSLVSVAILLSLYLAYVYVPPEDRAYQSPYLKTVHSDFANTGDFKIHYTHAGQGEPLILIHGSCAWFFGFRYNIPALAEKFSVYALDMPGNGYTIQTCKDPDYTLDTMSNALLGFMDNKQIKKAVLIGHSSGGGWALHFASLHPDHVEKLVLIDSNGFDIPEKLSFRLFYIPVVGELFSKLFTIKDVRKGYEDAFYNKSLVTDEMVLEAKAPLTFVNNRRAQYLSIRNQNWGITEKALPNIKIPTLVIWGKNDQYLDYQLAYKFEKIMPDVRIIIIDKCGHSSHEEHPDKVNELILNFLASRSEGSFKSANPD